LPEPPKETTDSSALQASSGIKRHTDKAGRRRFVRIAGAACLVLGATTFGYSRYAGLFNRPPIARVDHVVSEFVPIASFEWETPARTINYIAPNSGEEIIFTDSSRHPDGVALFCSLFIDDGLVATSDKTEPTPVYSTRLVATSPETRHWIRIEAREKERLVTLLDRSNDPDDVCPYLLAELLGISSDLSYEWFVDGSEVGTTRVCIRKLPAGQHQIVLTVSDGMMGNTVQKLVTLDSQASSEEREIQVDPQSIPDYEERRTDLRIKGMNYKIDRRLDACEIEESLNVIRHELGCNSIKIVGGYEDLMVMGAEFAFEDGFDEVILNPRYEMVRPRDQNIHITEHISRIIAFSKTADELNERHGGIVLCVGDELTHSVRGIAEAATYQERVEENIRLGWENQAPKENSYLKDIVDGVRVNFRGRITYASSQAMWKYIKWRELGFDIIAPHLYFATEWYTEREFLQSISQLRSLGKPLYMSEFGASSYVGASRWGGDAWRHYQNEAYSPEEQAQYIIKSMDLYVQGRVDGVFPWCWMEYTTNDANNFGLMKFNPNRLASRKLAFYAYKSYQRSA